MALQIVEKSGEGLSRVYGVTVPAETLSQRLEARINEIRPQLQLKGFRPGKVPVAHVKRMYGKSLMGEVVQQTVAEANQQALEQGKVRPAGEPELDLDNATVERALAGEGDLVYDLKVDVMPDFEPIDVASIELKRPVHTPTDEEVQQQLEELAGQNRTYEAKEGKAVTAADGDLVVADFVGRIDGEAFEGGSAENAEITIGSGRFIPGFEEQLIGARPGATVAVKVSFPGDYPVDTLKGKAAEFEVTVKEVRGPVTGDIDDAFASRLGLSSVDALKDAIRSQLEQQYAGASRFKLKRALLDVLDERHDFPLPPRMVETEFNAIWSQLEQERAQGELSEEDQGKTDEQLRAEYRKIAERRVRLGLVLAEIGRRNDVTVTEQEIAQAMRQEALRYRGQEQQVFDMLRQNPDAQAQLRAPVYEEKVVDLITSKAKVADQEVSRDELFQDDELPEGYAEGGEAKPAKAKPAKKPAAKPKAAASGAKPAKAEGDDAKPAKSARPKAPKKPKADAEG